MVVNIVQDFRKIHLTVSCPQSPTYIEQIAMNDPSFSRLKFVTYLFTCARGRIDEGASLEHFNQLAKSSAPSETWTICDLAKLEKLQLFFVFFLTISKFFQLAIFTFYIRKN